MRTSLALKYRPATWDDLFGQELAVRLFKNILIENKFHSSYLLTGLYGAGKCIEENSFIFTNNGTIPIKEAYGEYNISVASESRVNAPARCIFSGLKPTIKIISDKGYEIEGTPHHRIRVINQKGYIVWKKLKDIKINDYAVIQKGFNLFGRDKKIDIRGPFESRTGLDLRELVGIGWEGRRIGNESQRAVAIKYGVSQAALHRLVSKSSPIKHVVTGANGHKRGLPVTFSFNGKLDREMAWILGYATGNGNFTRGDFNICLENKYIDWIQERVEKVFHRKAGVSRDKRHNCSTLRITDTWLVDFFKALGIYGHLSPNKIIPEVIMKGSRKIVSEFLNGLFSADGWIQGNSNPAIMLASENLINQIMILLLNFGILSTKRKKWNRNYKRYYYGLTVPADYVGLFRNEIGIDHPAKKGKLEKWRPFSSGNTAFNIIPGLHRFNYRLNVTRKRLPVIMNRIKNKGNPLLALHRKLENFVYVKISEIERKESRVYDMVVPQEKNFIANGFIAHNTTVARIFAKSVNCASREGANPCNKCDSCRTIGLDENIDYMEMDGASSGGVDSIRRIKESIQYKPLLGKKKIFTVDECFERNTPIWTEQGLLPIGNIVSNKKSIKVASFNKDKNIVEFKPILNWIRKIHNGDMMAIKIKGFAEIKCTPDHKIYTRNGTIKANDLNIGDKVLYRGFKFSDIQRQVIYGTLLGDAYLSRSSANRYRMGIRQGIKQKDYCLLKYRIFKNIVRTIPRVEENRGGGKQCMVFSTAIDTCFDEVAKKVLVNNKKTITKEWLEEITPLGLAFWYMDDGSRSHQPYIAKHPRVKKYAFNVTLSTHRYSLDNQKLLVNFLHTKYGIEAQIKEDSRGRGFYLYLTSHNTNKFMNLIRPYANKYMAYKFDTDNPTWDFNYNACPELSTAWFRGDNVIEVPIESIRKFNSKQPVYDIEVADNHNYFARNLLVSNCHALSSQALNAFLKIFEEAPEHAIFILATTEAHKVPDPVSSRCMLVALSNIPAPVIAERLKLIAKKEDITYDDKSIELIATQAQGSMRDAITMMEQVAILTSSDLNLESTMAMLGVIDFHFYINLFKAMVDKNLASVLKQIEAFKTKGAQPTQITKELLLLLNKAIQNCIEKNISNSAISLNQLLKLFNSLTWLHSKVLRTWQSEYSALEVGLISIVKDWEPKEVVGDNKTPTPASDLKTLFSSR